MVAPAIAGSFLMASASVKPSASGIWKSVSTRWNGRPDSCAARSARERFGHAGRQRRDHAPADEHLFEQAPVRGVVVDDEDGQVSQIDRVGNRRHGGGAVTSAKLAVKWNVLPLPASLSTQRRPPISCTSCDEMVRPSPVPPYVRVMEPSACVKASKTLLLTVQRDADARVPDGEVQHDVLWCRRLPRHAKHDLALVGELDGVPEQIDENLAQASGVASQRRAVRPRRHPRSVRGPSGAPSAPPRSPCRRWHRGG